MIKKPKGKLGILTPGMGAVASTFMAGVIAINKGIAEPIGSLTQMGTIRLGKRTENRRPKIKDFVPITDLKDIVFGGWDIFSDNMYKAALNAAVLEKDLLKKIRPELKAIKPMKAVFDKNYVKKLDGKHVKKGKTKMDLAKQLMQDIKNFKKENGCD
jgi:myo-inositol-1-phosphate synthase